jgi:hypothetical protein
MSLLLFCRDFACERNLLHHIAFYKWTTVERFSSDNGRERVCDPI